MRSLSRRFRDQAGRTPGAVALIAGEERVTFADLAERTTRLGSCLRRRGLERGDGVAVALPHSPDLISALLAVDEAGAVCVGIDPRWPCTRIRDVLEDSTAKIALVQDRRAAGALPFGGNTIAISECGARPCVPPPHIDAEADRVFSIVYTSGSTGRPKGVLVTLHSVVNKLEWMWSAYPLRPGDIAFVHRPCTAAGFPLDCFGALLHGMPTVISPVDDTRDVHGIVKAACAAGVTHCGGSVGFWEAAVNHAERHPGSWSTLRLARSSGEPLPPGLVVRFRIAFPGARLLNIYGASECSGSTVYDTSLFDPTDAGRVPVGRPIRGVEVLIVDSDMRPVPAGEWGEICVAGASLARGYLGRPDLTRERFGPHPGGLPNAHVFRTGDFGLLGPDGLDITGRCDLQVKIRGYRVEIEEVEAALRRCPGVRAAAVHGQPDAGSTRLIAFVVIDAGSTSPPTIRRVLENDLPSYMVPAQFVVVDALPRTSTGKVDRTALSTFETEPQVRTPPQGTQPRTRTEAAVIAVWADVLGLADIGPEDDFFEIGGHSLSAAQIVSRLGDVLGIAVPLRMLFDHPSVGDLAREVDGLLAEQAALGRPQHESPTMRIGECLS